MDNRHYQLTVGWLSTSINFRSGNRTPKATTVEGDERLWFLAASSVLIHYVCAFQTSHLHNNSILTSASITAHVIGGSD